MGSTTLKMRSSLALILGFLCCLTSGYKIVETFSNGVIEDGPYGGTGGEPWTDGGEIHLNGFITELEIRSQSEIDNLRTKYGDVWTDGHGGSGGQQHNVKIEADEKIIIVQGRSEKRIDAIEFITDKGVVHGPFGGNGGDPFVSSHPGCYLSYFSGASHSRLDSITLHWECP